MPLAQSDSDASHDASVTRTATFMFDGQTYLLISAPLNLHPHSELTGSENAIAGLLLRGESMRSIAQRRGAAARTVANQIQQIYRKLNVHSREELAAIHYKKEAHLIAALAAERFIGYGLPR